MKRRGFLQAMLAAAAAPAIVKAENLMKIVVPKKELIILDELPFFGLGNGDFTVEMWVSHKDMNRWKHMAVCRSADSDGVSRTKTFEDGAQVNEREFVKHWPGFKYDANGIIIGPESNPIALERVSDLRVTKGFSRENQFVKIAVERKNESMRIFTTPTEGTAHQHKDSQFMRVRELLNV